jgi:hypothetical protein
MNSEILLVGALVVGVGVLYYVYQQSKDVEKTKPYVTYSPKHTAY